MKIVGGGAGGERALLRTELVYKTSFGVLALGIRKKKNKVVELDTSKFQIRLIRNTPVWQTFSFESLIAGRFLQLRSA